MQIKKLDLNNPEECEKWESFVYKNGYIYQSIKWCKILENSYNFDSIYLYLEDNGEIISLLPLFHVKLLPFKNELVSIPHVESGGFINTEYYEPFLEYIKNNYRVKNIKIYQFKNGIGDYAKNDTNSLFMMNVPDTVDDVYTVIKRGIKRSIKNILENSGVEITKGNSEEFIKTLYDFNVIKHKEFGVPHHSYKFFSALVRSFNDSCDVFVAKKDGRKIGASFIIYYGDVGYHMYHFIPHEFLKIKAGAVLYFHLFKECCERGLKKFSFGRSPKGSGVYKFKMQMHATPYPLYIYDFLLKDDKFEAEKIKILSERFSWAAKIWSKMPMPLTNCISSKLRKWIY